MRKINLAMCIAVLAAPPALAADATAAGQRGMMHAPSTGSSWTGFYMGANAGYAGGTARTSATGIGSGSAGYDGLISGGQIGYNWQSGKIVFGVETDLQASGVEYTETSFGIIARSRLDYLGTVRGRIGVTFASIMPYVTAGIAYGQNTISASGFGTTIRDQQTHLGWTIGAGVEAQISSGWSVKGEYLYVDLGRETYFSAIAGGFQAEADFHTARIGLNYRF
jgi:outer membrane immunogenic protein